MKYTSLILTVLLFSEINAQQKSEEPTIQNFYSSCKAQKYIAFNLVNTGIQLFGSRQYSRSLNKFHAALEKDPELCDAWYLIGYAHQQRGELRESIDACKKSLELNPKNVSAHIIAAYTNILLNDTTEAVTNLEQAKELAPELIDSYYGIALISYWRGDPTAVLSEFSDFQTNKNEKVEKTDIRTFEKLVDQSSNSEN